MMRESKSTLFIVATPIGNLEDITFRAINVLKSVDYILCEDKRISKKLLDKYNIKTKLISFHKFNELDVLENITRDLISGINIALISDAGTPVVSDPGALLVKSCRDLNINVFSIPGPSALTAALSVSGIAFHEFLFVGFLPDQMSKRTELIKSFRGKSKLIIIYIAPHDLKKYLLEISKIFPGVRVFYSREITKIYEDFWSGSIENLIDKNYKAPLKGEIVLGIDFSDYEVEDRLSESDLLIEMKSYINDGCSIKQASKLLSKVYNISSNHLYNLFIKYEK